MKNTRNDEVEIRVFLPSDTKVTRNVIKLVDTLLSFSPPSQYRCNLTQIYHEYIIKYHEALPISFEDMANDMYCLIDFFQRVENEVDEK